MKAALSCLQLVALYYKIADVCCLPTITSSTAQDKVVSYLQELGYLPTSEEDSHIDHSAALPTAIESFQSMARLPISGVVDERTVRMMNEPRCGVKDPIDVGSRKKRFAHSGSKWQSNILRWRVTQFPSQFSHVKVIELMKAAFEEWSAVTNLYFEYKPTGTIDIEVKFASGSHDDGYRFDGSGGILAHAFFPPPSESQGPEDDNAGDLHFDADERWSVSIHSNVTGQNLFHVAVHEIGHTLGLQHSNAEGSVMWPWSKQSTRGTDGFKLSYDDVLAVQTLYGGKRRRFARDGGTHRLCDQSVDAIFEAVDGNIYLFTGNTVLQLNPATFEQVGGPHSISSIFHGMPDQATVHAAVSPRNPIFNSRKSYVFLQDRYYRYSYTGGQLRLDTGYPYSITLGWSIDVFNFDTIFNLENKVTLMFVKGNQYWSHTGTSYGVYDGYPKYINTSAALDYFTDKGTINAAFLHPNGTNYFFTDDHVYSYDYTSYRVVC